MTKIRHFFLFLFAAGPVCAEEPLVGHDRYQSCIGLIAQDAQKARTDALSWYMEGGGVAARHCEALALFSLEHFEEAARLFEKLAGEVIIGDGMTNFAYEKRGKLKGELYTHAAFSWQALGKFDKAYNNFTVALVGADKATRRELYLDRGLLQMDRHEDISAIKDFTQAIELAPKRHEGYFHRALAFRRLKSHHRARLDIEKGLTISPIDPDLLLESGILYRVTGDKKSAREEWEKIINATDGEFRGLARRNIELLDE